MWIFGGSILVITRGNIGQCEKSMMFPRSREYKASAEAEVTWLGRASSSSKADCRFPVLEIHRALERGRQERLWGGCGFFRVATLTLIVSHLMSLQSGLLALPPARRPQVKSVERQLTFRAAGHRIHAPARQAIPHHAASL
jgi:hypothetical protein